MTGMTARAILTRVSVVMMARAKSSALAELLPTADLRAGMAAMTFSAGKGTPMMPVDEGTTSSKMQPKVCAAATQVAMQPSIPGAPVAQLALPALTRTAPKRPPVESRWRRPTMTGAATTRFEVYMTAATAPPGATAMATSVFPLALIPARTAPHTNPAGIVSVGKVATSIIL